MRSLSEIPLTRMGFHEDDLNGETAIVTGGGRGIGRELALLLSRLGAQVVIAEISQDDRGSASELESGKCLWVQTDVSDEQHVTRTVSDCRDRFGEPTILVNNAIYCPVKPLVEMTAQEWDKVTSVNLRGAFLAIRAVLPGMVTRRHGVVVNMISAPSMPCAAAYAATKQALESLAHSVAGEVEGSGVSVVAFGPGMVETEGGVGAFRSLSGYLGVSYDQMTHSGLNPGYDGLVPAYDSALSLAYVICHASEYNNQTVMMHEPLPRLVPAESGAGQQQTSGTAPVGDLAALAELGSHGMVTVTKMKAMLEETQAEFNKLPFFARPMALSGFKRKAGISVSDLATMVRSLSEFLREAVDGLRAGKSEPWNEGRQRFLETWRNAPDVFTGLAAYYREAPSETARFVKDRQALAEITQTCFERESTATALAVLVADIENGAPRG